jgi:hypothetical protein
VIHDTGYWDTSKYTDLPDFVTERGRIVPQRRDEIMFADWLEETYGYGRIDFSTTKEFRCGLTVLKAGGSP